MTTVIQFYNLLKGDSNDRFEAMWAKIVGSDFYYFLHIFRPPSLQITKYPNFREI